MFSFKAGDRVRFVRDSVDSEGRKSTPQRVAECGFSFDETYEIASVRKVCCIIKGQVIELTRIQHADGPW